MSFDEATRQHLEKELLPFLTLEARIDVKSVAIRYFLEMTGSKEGRNFISQGGKFMEAIMLLTKDTQPDAAKDALLTLINLTSEDTISWQLMSTDNGSAFIFELLHSLLKPDFVYADEASSIVANVTRLPAGAKRLAERILKEESVVTMDKIVDVLCQVKFNKKATLHYIGPILSNLTQVSDVRKTIMDKDRCIMQKLLPFTEYSESTIRRGGIIGTLRNCCFEYDYHPWLLSDDVDILSRLLLPLAGGEEFDDDEMEKLPVDLQYLPPEKNRESDPDLRRMLIEAIMQLCSTKQGRLHVKEKNAYVILRELHKWEKDSKAKLACQKLCELLISEEPEAGMEELHKVEVPSHLVEKFEKLDTEILKDMEEDVQDETQEQQTSDKEPSQKT